MNGLFLTLCSSSTTHQCTKMLAFVICEMVEERGARLLYHLPAYSPIFNPIDLSFFQHQGVAPHKPGPRGPGARVSSLKRARCTTCSEKPFTPSRWSRVNAAWSGA